MNREQLEQFASDYDVPLLGDDEPIESLCQRVVVALASSAAKFLLSDVGSSLPCLTGKSDDRSVEDIKRIMTEFLTPLYKDHDVVNDGDISVAAGPDDHSVIVSLSEGLYRRILTNDPFAFGPRVFDVLIDKEGGAKP